MSKLGLQAATLAIARLASYGLLVLGPIFLVHLLSVPEFGRYREFMLYASVLQWIAAFSINDSLLYFIPKYPQNTSQVLRQAVTLTVASSVAVVALAIGIDRATGGALLGAYWLGVAAYVLLYVNLDFWETFCIASHKPVAVLAYSVGCLGARLTVAVIAAAMTRRTDIIIQALLVFEAVRLILSAAVWVRLSKASPAASPVPGLWREQLKCIMPTGLTVVAIMLNRNLGNIAVAKSLGPVGLAHYTIGLYGEPIFQAFIASVFTALMPEMVRRNQQSRACGLDIWRRVVVAIFAVLIPGAVVLALFGGTLIVNVFGQSYGAAVPVFEIYLLAVIRSAFDTAVPLRAVGDTRPLIITNVAALVVNGAALMILLPKYGISGAVLALVLGLSVEPLYLSGHVMRHYDSTLRQLLPWKSLLKIVISAVSGAGLIMAFPVEVRRGWSGVVGCSLLYAAVYVGIVWLIRVDEVAAMLNNIRKRHSAIARHKTLASEEKIG